MSTLLLVRHGQARLFTEDYDRLSKLGARQAACIGKFLIDRSIPADIIYSGTLTRQQQTANTVIDALQAARNAASDLQILSGFNEYPGEDVMRHLIPQLRASNTEIDRLAEEYNLKQIGKTRKLILYQKLITASMRHWIRGDYTDPNGVQTWVDFSSGVRAALSEVMQRTGSGKTVVIFTSGGPIGVCVQSILNAPQLEAADLLWRVYNCSITRFVFSGTRISLDAFNDTAHLSPDLITRG